MRSLNSIGMIAAPSLRTAAYLQILAQNNFVVSKVYFFVKKENEVTLEKTLDIEGFDGFLPSVSLMNTICKFQIPYEIINETDMNSEYALQFIHSMPEGFLIYSGYAGVILKPALFESGKKFIHVHPGLLPQYRGSTTVYYSILKENICAATAMFMSPQLDAGLKLAEETFAVPSRNVNIDYVFEPYIRAKVLLKAINIYFEKGAFQETEQSEKGECTYYVIHPILKNRALQSRSLL